MGPQNGIMGNDAFGTELPQTQTPDDAFNEVVNTAKFSKTKEFQELKKYFESRMDFYKAYLPDGKPVIATGLDMSEVGYMWVIANAVIGEFKAVIDVYEQAAQTVKDESTRRK